MTITINGDFFAVDQYLFRLEVLPRISKVLSISLAPGPDRLPELSLSIQADFFTTDTSAGPGTVPGAQGAGSQPIPAPAPSTSATPTPTLTIPTASPSSTG